MQDLIFLVKSAPIAVFFAYIICDTSAVEEYLRLFSRGKMKVFRKSELYDDSGLFTFQDKIISTYDNFLIRLIFCPTCQIVWSSLAMTYDRLDLTAPLTVLSWVAYAFTSRITHFKH